MSATKLTDAQLLLLSAAAQHREGAIDAASGLKGGATTKAIGKLLPDGFIEEIPARGEMLVWWRDDAGPVALRITPPGLAVIGVEAGGAEPKADKPRETQDGGETAPKPPSRRVEAAHRKKNKDEALQGSAEASPRDSKQAREAPCWRRSISITGDRGVSS
jgi:hypothetical protein